jgi:ABC-type uncharacterized transport system YnjBCD ATPase subunit
VKILRETIHELAADPAVKAALKLIPRDDTAAVDPEETIAGMKARIELLEARVEKLTRLVLNGQAGKLDEISAEGMGSANFRSKQP